jgi:peptide/nickel transport system substrate-binding protein
MKESGNVWFKEAESIRTFYFIINHAKAPLNDVNMRRALCCMFDYEGFNNGILGGTVVRNPGIIPNPMWGAPKDLKGYTYDIDKAKWRPLPGQGEDPPAADRRHGRLPAVRAGRPDAPGRRRQGRASRSRSSPSPSPPSPPSSTTPTARMTWCRSGAAPTSPTRTTGPAILFNSEQLQGRQRQLLQEPAHRRTDRPGARRSPTRRSAASSTRRPAASCVDDAVGIFINNTKFYGPTARA